MFSPHLSATTTGEKKKKEDKINGVDADENAHVTRTVCDYPVEGAGAD